VEEFVRTENMCTVISETEFSLESYDYVILSIYSENSLGLHEDLGRKLIRDRKCYS
jgi:hypothetical protein